MQKTDPPAFNCRINKLLLVCAENIASFPYPEIP